MEPHLPTRPCWVEINTSALEHNYRFLRELAGPRVECLAVVKADAYGHSLALCAPAVVRAGAKWLGVTSVEEGIAARAACPHSRILVIGGVFPGQAAAVLHHALTASVWTAWHLDELEAAAKQSGATPQSVAVHLEIDTGMSRQGANLEELPALLARFHVQSPLRIEAVMTHLYASDEAQGETTPEQLQVLESALSTIGSGLPQHAHPPEYLSVGASAALIAGMEDQLEKLAAQWKLTPMLRLGLAIYGLVPPFDPQFAPADIPPQLAAARTDLKPVLAWKSRVVSLRSVPPGTEVGYNGTFIATEPMRLALIAAGYADGVDRRLGNHFSFLVRGQRAPLAGRVSMDQIVLDVTEIPDCAPGDEVVLIGTQGSETIGACEHADAAGTIPWEVFTRIAARVYRTVV